MSDKLREEFEAWYLREHFEGDTQCGMEWLSTEPCGGYRHAEPSKQWKAWQASRAALVVELPKQYGIGGLACDAHDRAVAWCGEAIEAAGVRVKP